MVGKAIVPEQDDLLGNLIQEGPVVRYHNNGSVFQCLQIPLQP